MTQELIRSLYSELELYGTIAMGMFFYGAAPNLARTLIIAGKKCRLWSMAWARGGYHS